MTGVSAGLKSRSSAFGLRQRDCSRYRLSVATELPECREMHSDSKYCQYQRRQKESSYAHTLDSGLTQELSHAQPHQTFDTASFNFGMQITWIEAQRSFSST